MVIMEKVAAKSIASPPRQCRLFLVGLLFLVVLAAFFQNAKAYVLEGVHWPSGSLVTFQLALGSAGRTLIDGNTSWNTAAAPAPNAWNNVMGTLTYQANPQSATAVSGDGENTIVFSSTVFGDSFGASTLAVTVYSYSGSIIQEADVLFNNHKTFNSYRGPLRYDGSGNSIGDIRRVLVHELGHALGLDHPDDHGQHVDAIMNSRTSNREALSADDIAGARHLYGASVPDASGSTTPLDDLNSDGSLDFVLYNSNTRQTAVWYLNNNTLISGLFGPTLPAGWRVAGVADFNHDGQVDYLLFNASTNQTAVWYLSDLHLISGAYGPTIAAGYTLAGVVDFNGDGNPDYILFSNATRRTAIWYLNSAAFVTGVYGPTLPINWRIAGLADFNNDSNLDYLLFNLSTRQSAIWYLSGSALSRGTSGPTPPAGYSLKGAADFDNDGHPDYLLYNPTSRQTLFWYLNGSAALIGNAPGPGLPSPWAPSGT
jgi:Matrixin/FG-GAP-like repeat